MVYIIIILHMRYYLNSFFEYSVKNPEFVQVSHLFGRLLVKRKQSLKILKIFYVFLSNILIFFCGIGTI